MSTHDTALRDARPETIDEIIAELAPGAAHRDLERELPVDFVNRLLAAGLGALRVPAGYGGGGATIAELAEVLIALAAADSNLAQIFRGHLGFVERLRLWPRTPASEALLRSAGNGALFGPAASEKARPDGAASTLFDIRTRLVEDDEGLWLSGEKYYTTGSLFADWINVLVPQEQGFAEVVVPRDSPGLTILDDWQGFGQRLTASGTAIFDRVPVLPEHVFIHADQDAFRYIQAFYQFVHVSTQAGIAQRISADIAETVRGRTRSYPLAATSEPSKDHQVLAVVGETESRAYAARATARQLALDLEKYIQGSKVGDALDQAVIGAASAQISNTRLVGESAWLLFDAGSASSTDTALDLDRHWRNARTVSSHNPVIYKAAQIGNYLVSGVVANELASLRPARS